MQPESYQVTTLQGGTVVSEDASAAFDVVVQPLTGFYGVGSIDVAEEGVTYYIIRAERSLRLFKGAGLENDGNTVDDAFLTEATPGLRREMSNVLKFWKISEANNKSIQYESKHFCW